MGLEGRDQRLAGQASVDEMDELADTLTEAILKNRHHQAVCLRGGCFDLIHVGKRADQGLFTDDMPAFRQRSQNGGPV